jgi:hypothetical protein
MLLVSVESDIPKRMEIILDTLDVGSHSYRNFARFYCNSCSFWAGKVI